MAAKTGIPAIGRLALLVVATDAAWGVKIRAACTPAQLAAYNSFISCAQGIVQNDFAKKYEP